MNRFQECLLNAEVSEEKPEVTLERMKRISNFGKDRGTIEPERKNKIGTFHAEQFIKEYSPLSEVKEYKRMGDICDVDNFSDHDKVELLKAFYKGEL